MDPASPDDTVWVMEHFFKNKKIFQYNSLSDLLGTDGLIKITFDDLS